MGESESKNGVSKAMGRIGAGEDWVVCPLCDRRLVAFHNLTVAAEVQATHVCNGLVLVVKLREASE